VPQEKARPRQTRPRQEQCLTPEGRPSAMPRVHESAAALRLPLLVARLDVDLARRASALCR